MILPVTNARNSQAILIGAAAWGLIAWGAFSPTAGRGDDAVADRQPKLASGGDLFAGGGVRHLRLEVAPDDLAGLRRDSRRYVRATVREGKESYGNVGVHLKGRTGSFRGIDGKPSLTLNFGRFTFDQRFHGLRKIHLNNSVEDPSYLNEYLGGEIFRAAGVPAPRVAFALVELNGRKLGLYTLKEGFTEDFLKLYFQHTNGNLYETGTDPESHDVNGPMKRSLGEGSNDRADLRALAAAAQEPDLARRWQQLEQVLDVGRFVSFMAAEVLICHRDGYCLARNNFRIYHDVETDKLMFLPQGMDNLLGRPDLTWQPRMAGLVAKAVWEVPEGRRRYRERIGVLLTNVFKVAELTDRVNQLVAQIRPALNGRAARELEQQASVVKERIAQRALELGKQLSEPEPRPVPFENDIAKPTGWRIVDKPAGGRLEQCRALDGRAALRITAGPVTAASWRAKVLLAAGRYRFEGLATTAGVIPLKFGKSKGARLRVSGLEASPSHELIGDSTWQPLAVEFAVGPGAEEVELICELRASKGEVWFDLESLRLVRLK